MSKVGSGEAAGEALSNVILVITQTGTGALIAAKRDATARLD